MIETFRPDDGEAWQREHGAVPTGAFFEGTLLDNYMLECDEGFCAVYEEPLNEWSSCHVYKLARYGDFEAIDALWAEFYERQEEAEA